VDIKGNELRSAAKALADAATSLQSAVNANASISADRARALVAPVRVAYQALVGLAGAQSSTDLGDFMRSVGVAVVDAQRQLDTASKQYVREIVAGDTESLGAMVQPAVYRLPKVSAAVKFAFESIDSQRVGLIFYSDTETAKSSHQQSIEFEIVAVPPTPEALAAAREAGAPPPLAPRGAPRTFAQIDAPIATRGGPPSAAPRSAAPRSAAPRSAAPVSRSRGSEGHSSPQAATRSTRSTSQKSLKKKAMKKKVTQKKAPKKQAMMKKVTKKQAPKTKATKKKATKTKAPTTKPPKTKAPKKKSGRPNSAPAQSSKQRPPRSE